MTTIEKIRAEIERRMKKWDNLDKELLSKNSEFGREAPINRWCELKDLLSFIESLEKEQQPQELDEAAEEYESTWYGAKGIASESFKAGAKWMTEQGVSIDGKVVMDFSDPGDIINRRLVAKLGDSLLHIEPGDVIVQIREK